MSKKESNPLPPKKIGGETMKAIPFKFELGEVLKDVVTGFEGVVMGRTQYYTQCNHYGLLPQRLDKDKKEPEWGWFDETRLVRAKKKAVMLKVERPTSGPFPNAPGR